LHTDPSVIRQHRFTQFKPAPILEIGMKQTTQPQKHTGSRPVVANPGMRLRLYAISNVDFLLPERRKSR
jgi:hypothetical protein